MTIKKSFIGALIAGNLALGGPAISMAQNITSQKKQQKTETPAKQSKSVFDKKYKIDTRADFDKLYKAAKPFLFATLMGPENWHTDFYKDNGKTINTVGVGNYYVGVNSKGELDFTKNGKAMLTSTYVKKYKNAHKGAKPKNLTPEQTYLHFVWYWEYMDNGAHLKDLYNRLQGAELTINEFSAIASVYWNKNSTGRQLCSYIAKNYKDQRKCGLRVLQCACPADYPGLPSRRVHECLIYLNYDNYCSEIYDNIKINGKVGTSVADVGVHRVKLRAKNGFTDANLTAAKKAIFENKVENGKNLRFWIKKLSSGYSSQILYFSSQKSSGGKVNAVAETKQEPKEIIALYNIGVARYHKKDYGGALAMFKQVEKKGGFGAGLYNDIAMCYYHLKQYQNCINYCGKVLKTGERKEYMSATYNAALAYWKNGDYNGAIRNFEAAIRYAKEFKDEKKQTIYENKLKECKIDQGTKKIQQKQANANAQNAYGKQTNAKAKNMAQNMKR